MDDLFAKYYESLLRLQYQISEEVQQMLPRGTIREEFLKEILLKKRASLQIKKGIIYLGKKQSNECDLIFHNTEAVITSLGEQLFIHPKDCNLVLEVKSNSTTDDLKKSNKNFGLVKSLDSDHKPLCGVFCYNVDLEKKTVLERFGYSYDKELDSWQEDLRLELLYPNIDFIICIASLSSDEDCTEEQFFLRRDEQTGRYLNYLDFPIIKNFFTIIENL